LIDGLEAFGPGELALTSPAGPEFLDLTGHFSSDIGRKLFARQMRLFERIGLTLGRLLQFILQMTEEGIVRHFLIAGSPEHFAASFDRVTAIERGAEMFEAAHAESA
jgi:hypothetical protein